MATLFKRKNGVWYASISIDGIRKQYSLKTKNERDAKARFAKYQLLEENPNAYIQDSRLTTLGQFLKTHLAIKEGEISPGWFKISNFIINSHIVPFFGENTPLSKITTRRLEEYRSHRIQQGAAARTINNEHAVISRILRHAASLKIISEPIPRLQKLKTEDTRLRFLSREEADKFFEIAELSGEGKHLFCLLCLYAGLRRGEAFHLRWEDLDLKRSILTIAPHDVVIGEKKIKWIPKWHKTRHVPIHEKLKAWLLNIPENKRRGQICEESKDTLYRCVPKIAEAAEIDSDGENKVSAHTLRHTFASRLVMRGVPLYTVAKLLGHSSVETTRIYAHLAPDHLEGAVNQLDI